MRGSLLSSLVAGLLLVVSSCAHDVTVAPDGLLHTRGGVLSVELPSVRISEFHYDNGGTDGGERIEISGPAGTNLTGWTIVLYNGSNGLVYDTDPLTGIIPHLCESGGELRGVVFLSYPSNGIQNGAPDGIALVNNGALVEFLSYEGPMTAVDGPAKDLLSTDIGVSQSGSASETVGSSLQRDGSGVWRATPGANTFGACNDHITPPPVDRVELSPATATVIVGGFEPFTARAFDASNNELNTASFVWTSSNTNVATVSASGVVNGIAVGNAVITARADGTTITRTATVRVEEPGADPPPGSVFISEFHYDNEGSDVGERVEVQGAAGLNLSAWKIVLYNGNGGAQYATLNLSGVLGGECGGTGVKSIAAVGLQNGNTQNNEPDGLALVSPRGTVFEFLSYEGKFTASNGPANGIESTPLPRFESGSQAPGRSLQKDALGWYGPSRSTFDACNVATPAIAMFGRDSGDPPLPVGFEFQLFATYENARGDLTPTTITWTSESGLLSVDQDGVVHANGAGSGVIRATAIDGTTATFTVNTRNPVSGPAEYVGHAEFGEPTDANASDDFILRRREFTSSYNRYRGTPNWVSYNLEATHFGAEDRCNCFTFDPMLPADFPRYTTADYTGAGAAAGFGIDRGHLARSADRTSGSLDNATTYYFSNIIPQAAGNNQGPWARMETDLGNIARDGDKEVYIIAGVAGNAGSVKNENLITIPTHVWKVAVILDRNEGLSSIEHYTDPEIIAVIMPNVDSIRNFDWNIYRTTVNAVEAMSGYDVLALLDDRIELIAEAGMQEEFALVDQLITNGDLSAGNGNALMAKLEAAAESLNRNNRGAAVNQLEAFLHQVDALSRSRRLDTAKVTELRASILALIKSLGS